jgi:hypothetical protein
LDLFNNPTNKIEYEMFGNEIKPDVKAPVFESLKGKTDDMFAQDEITMRKGQKQQKGLFNNLERGGKRLLHLTKDLTKKLCIERLIVLTIQTQGKK